jgi:hypothetical protein
LVELNNNENLNDSNEIEIKNRNTKTINFFEYDDVVNNYGIILEVGKLSNVDDLETDNILLSDLNSVVISNPYLVHHLNRREKKVYGFWRC